jgi:2-amino-4-hydroxy-6-hydroxymethyldihydropteridine diphosphokinase
MPAQASGPRKSADTSLPLKKVYLSLGSNVGDRAAHIERAIGLFAEAGIEIRRVSSFYRTEPVDFAPQRWFINCAVEAATSLMPLQLLKAIKRIERRLGRRVSVAKGPRTIDIDILLYENHIIHTPALTIPHPRMTERRFVLIPLREIAASFRHPGTQRTVLEMLSDAKDASQVIRVRRN